MKTISLTSILMILLFSTVAFATTVHTEYEGSGDLEMTTILTSEVTPDIMDSVDITTGCDGGCCCLPDLSGSYRGTQVVSNDPTVLNGHTATTDEGCIEIRQTVYDELNGQKIYTDLYTYLEGEGTAESVFYVMRGKLMSFQLANGTGNSFVSFHQIVLLDDEFDYGFKYGGGVWMCSPGYAALNSGYNFYINPTYYFADLGLYCQHVDDSNIYAFLFAQTTDNFGLSSELEMDSIVMKDNIVAEGASSYGFTATTYDSLDYDFEMQLG
jgi:hypothetical protein